jgi:hypothetical protein
MHSNYRTLFKARMPSIEDLADAIDELEEDPGWGTNRDELIWQQAVAKLAS